MKSHLVSAYVQLDEGHRPHAEYLRLGAKLIELPVPKTVFHDPLDCCWMHGALAGQNYKARHGGDEKKNTLNYHIVQHQKTTWMLQAAALHPAIDIFVWIDYGIFHMEGVTPERIIDMMRACEDEEEIAIPGAWPKGQDGGPCWRFCGSVIICHREYLARLDHRIRTAAMAHAAATGQIIWEVNTWDVVETQGGLPIRWYGASHNGSLFTAYRKANP